MHPSQLWPGPGTRHSTGTSIGRAVKSAGKFSAFLAARSDAVVAGLSGAPVALKDVSFGAIFVDTLVPAKLALYLVADAFRGFASSLSRY